MHVAIAYKATLRCAACQESGRAGQGRAGWAGGWVGHVRWAYSMYRIVKHTQAETVNILMQRQFAHREDAD